MPGWVEAQLAAGPADGRCVCIVAPNPALYSLLLADYWQCGVSLLLSPTNATLDGESRHH